jgi:hypothetical protein
MASNRIRARLRLRAFFAILAAMVLVFAKQAISTERVVLPDDIYYHCFGSSALGTEAIWTNPAWMGLSRIVSTVYLANFHDGHLSKDWGMAIGGSKAGMAYRHLIDYLGKEYNEYIFGIGAQLNPKFCWGISYQYIKNGYGIFNKRHLWNASVLMQPNKAMNISGLFTNLNRGRIEGNRTAIEQTYAISYKLDGRLPTLSAEINFASWNNISKAPIHYGLAVPLTSKIMFYAEADNHGKYQFGFQVNLKDYFFGNRTRLESNWDDLGTSLYAGYTAPLTSPVSRR